jgi:hypothetical protein
MGMGVPGTQQQNSNVGAKNDSPVLLVKSLVKRDHANQHDAFSLAKDVLVLVVRTRLIAGILAILGRTKDEEGVAELNLAKDCFHASMSTPASISTCSSAPRSARVRCSSWAIGMTPCSSPNRIEPKSCMHVQQRNGLTLALLIENT